MNDNDKSLVIIGASYAKGWSISVINGFAVTNQGVGGNQSFEMSARFQEDVIELRPDVVIIWGFINDIFRARPGQLDSVKARVKSSFEQMVNQAERHNIKVLLATEVSVREPAGFRNWVAGIIGRLMGKTSYQSRVNEQVSELNLFVRDLADSRNILILDFHNVLADSDGYRRSEYATEDGSHLTSSAYEALTRYAEARITPACEAVTATH